MEKVMAGIDLHSNNLMIGIVDSNRKRLKHKKLACNLELVDSFLKPYQAALEGVAVESTFNWYWLVDGLRSLGYRNVQLANPAKIQQYSGLKHTDDKNDAYFLAELQHLNILPTGYIYDQQLRPVRDLLRRRLNLVRQRTALILSFKSLFTRTKGQNINLNLIKMMKAEQAEELYEHSANKLIAKIQKEHIDSLSESIEQIEKTVLESARELPIHEKICTLPGIGRILGMTITMEVGEISRFKTPGDFASYCRTVDSRCTSNDKKKGENNRKCGNKYLSWAFVEGANFAKRYDMQCGRWFDRKASKTNKILATKALACKLSKAAWHVMSKKVDYDQKRMFPEFLMKKKDK